MQTLAALKAGEKGVITKIEGGRTFAARVSSLGFVPDAELTVLQNFSRGPVLVGLKDCRIALGRGEAVKIKVRRI